MLEGVGDGGGGGGGGEEEFYHNHNIAWTAKAYLQSCLIEE